MPIIRLTLLVILIVIASKLRASSNLAVDIVRVGEERYERFRTEEGAIYVPATIYSSEGKFAEALCAGQLKDQEISVIKDNVDLKEASVRETKVLKRLIDRCHTLEAEGVVVRLKHS
jgi:hypothetical protein